MEHLFDKKANVSKSMLLVPLMFFLMPSLPITGSATVLDNEYLYILINYGIIYLILHLLMYLAIMFLFLRTGDRKIAILGIQYIIFSFLVGFQADTLVGWNYPVFIIFLTGVAISLVRRNKGIQTSQ